MDMRDFSKDKDDAENGISFIFFKSHISTYRMGGFQWLYFTFSASYFDFKPFYF